MNKSVAEPDGLNKKGAGKHERLRTAAAEISAQLRIDNELCEVEN